MMKKALLIIAAGAILGACAQMDADGKDHEYVEKTYRTGSNIPSHRDGTANAGSDAVSSASGQDVDNIRNSSASVPRSVVGAPGGGH